MDVKSCRYCRKLFNDVLGQSVCPSCRDKFEKKFQEVKEYIRSNKNVTIRDVVENCDVDEHMVRQWVREERLEFTKGVNVGIVCEICGTPISTGRYCEKCKASMVNDLKAASEKPQPLEDVKLPKDTKDRMRFIHTQ